MRRRRRRDRPARNSGDQPAADPARRKAVAPGVENRARQRAIRRSRPSASPSRCRTRPAPRRGAAPGPSRGSPRRDRRCAEAPGRPGSRRKLASSIGQLGASATSNDRPCDIAVALTGRVDHRLAAVDGDHRTARCDAPRQRRGVVPESAADLEDPAARRGAEQVIALALALGEERERVDQVRQLENTSKSEAWSTLWNPEARSSAMSIAS